MKIRPSILTVCLISGVPQFSLAESIGLNLGSGRPNAALDPTDSAGVVLQANWNNLAGANGGPLILNDDAGEATAAEVTWDTDEQWSQGDVPADADGKLLNGFFSENNNGGEDSFFTITGIPYPLYDLYVYVSHDRTAEDVVISEENEAFAAFTAVEDDAVITAPVTYTRQTESGVGTGTYVLFSSLDSSELKIILTAVDLGPGSLERNAISGIQIVDVTPEDSDGDGMHDAWEIANGLDPNDNGLNPNNNGVPGNPDNGAEGDPDADGSPNLRELEQKTNPQDEDSDGDTLLDGVETGTGEYLSDDDRGTSPIRRDTDDDGLEDNVESNSGTVADPEADTGTDPNEPDTDMDGLLDKWEVDNVLSPFDDGTTDVNNGPLGDPDNDESLNNEEQERGTDPQDEDTDDDNLLDGVETNDGDYVDGDATGTNPLSADTDGDTLPDDVEDNGGVYVDADETGTNPNLPDTDGDGLRDDWEIANGYDPHDGNSNVLKAGGIGINFGAGRPNAGLNPEDLAGVFSQANWNNLASSSGGPQSLTDDLGNPSGASASWDLDEQWSVAGPGAEPNGVLLTGWFSANNGGSPNTIDVTDIPYGNYDLLVYFNHDRSNETAEVSESNEAFPMFVVREDNSNVLNPVVFDQQVASSADVPTESGNFAIFQNLTASNLNLVLSGGAGTNARNPLTGIQIINRGSTEIVIIDVVSDKDAGSVELTWNSASGRVYSIDRSSDLAPDGWLELDDGITASGDTTSYTDSGIDFSSTPRRFYRVRLTPSAP